MCKIIEVCIYLNLKSIYNKNISSLSPSLSLSLFLSLSLSLSLSLLLLSHLRSRGGYYPCWWCISSELRKGQELHSIALLTLLSWCDKESLPARIRDSHENKRERKRKHTHIIIRNLSARNVEPGTLLSWIRENAFSISVTQTKEKQMEIFTYLSSLVCATTWLITIPCFFPESSSLSCLHSALTRLSNSWEKETADWLHKWDRVPGTVVAI